MALVALIASLGKPCEQSWPHLTESTPVALQFAGWFHSLADHHNHFAKEILIVPFEYRETEAQERLVMVSVALSQDTTPV